MDPTMMATLFSTRLCEHQSASHFHAIQFGFRCLGFGHNTYIAMPEAPACQVGSVMSRLFTL